MSAQRAFSMIELIIVVVIMGIIAAIAVPRLSSAADNAAGNAIVHDQSAFQRAIDLYAIEHEGALPHVGAANRKVFALRLVGKTFEDGSVDASGHLGPYLHAIPNNKINGLATFRIDGVAAGANLAGWRYDSSTGVIEPDHSGTGRAALDNAKIQGEIDAAEAINALKKP